MSKSAAFISALASFAMGLGAQNPSTVLTDAKSHSDLLGFQRTGQYRKAFDKAVEIRDIHPNDYWALVAIESCIYQIPSPERTYLDEAERASRYLLDNLDAVSSMDNKPPEIPANQFEQLRLPMQAFAQGTLGYVYMQKKDHERAETELLKALQLDSTQSQFALFLADELLAQQRAHPEKQPLALFYFARAAAYDGPNAIPTVRRLVMLEFVTRAYNSYHGSAEGLDKLLEWARIQAFPPADFRIDVFKREFIEK